MKSVAPSMSDTTPEATRLLINGYRRMSHLDKLKQVGELNRSVLDLALLDIRRRHPRAGDTEIRLRLASRWIDPELMRKFFDWDPATEGY